MKTINIKGKEYVEVNERIMYFKENYKGSIETEIISIIDGVCIMKATIKVDGEIVATGHAYEKEGSTFINKTSYIENCETSAVGRALGLFGIGIDASIASFEEVANAVNNQKQMATAEQISELSSLFEEKRIKLNPKQIIYIKTAVENGIDIDSYNKTMDNLRGLK